MAKSTKNIHVKNRGLIMIIFLLSNKLKVIIFLTQIMFSIFIFYFLRAVYETIYALDAYLFIKDFSDIKIFFKYLSDFIRDISLVTSIILGTMGILPFFIKKDKFCYYFIFIIGILFFFFLVLLWLILKHYSVFWKM